MAPKSYICNGQFNAKTPIPAPPHKITSKTNHNFLKVEPIVSSSVLLISSIIKALSHKLAANFVSSSVKLSSVIES